jgi:CRP-like cAMP-binding protein
VEREQVLFRLFGKFCPEGTILYTEGSPGQEAFVIQSGAVRLGATLQAGGRAGLLGPGDLLGEESFFVKAPRAARAEVVQDTRLIQVNDTTLDAVVRHGPQTARGLFDQLLALTQRARSEATLWTVGQLLNRLAPALAEAAGDGVLPADLVEGSGLPAADVLLVLEELRLRGCLVCDGARYRAPDLAPLQREIDRLAPRREPS